LIIYFGLFIIYFLECLHCVDIIVMVVVHMVDNKNWIFDMVWSKRHEYLFCFWFFCGAFRKVKSWGQIHCFRSHSYVKSRNLIVVHNIFWKEELVIRNFKMRGVELVLIMVEIVSRSFEISFVFFFLWCLVKFIYF